MLGEGPPTHVHVSAASLFASALRGGGGGRRKCAESAEISFAPRFGG